MSTCLWCTPGGPATTDLLKNYAAKQLHGEDLLGANDDLNYCMECVVEYHRVREEVPYLHKALCKLETSRLITQLEKSMSEEIEEDDELFLVEEDGEKQVHGYTGPLFESNLRVPLLEILKYPYLLLNQKVSELCCDALCKMEQANNSFQVYEKLPGVYLLLVHPNEIIRRWAILTARVQGKVDRDDYYDLQEVFTCLFKVIELGLFENPDIYGYTEVEEGKLILLPSHLYDTTNYKNYWLGICMLLTVLEEQAMDSLLLGHDKQNNFMQSILHIMEKQTEDESANPFWPALHCFMMILDRLGSKVWGQLIDPIQAFQTIIGSPSYNREIDNIRNSYGRTTKPEPEADCEEDIVSCSQMVYHFNAEKKKKDTGWKNAICPDYCPNMYEEMQSLANVLQSDIGQDMRVHNSTFLWFVPFVQSVMDLKDLGVAYIMEVIHHLYSEIKDVLNQRSQQCDKVTELFILVLVSIIELHRNKKCLHLLWVSSYKWVEALVKCSVLPAKDFKLRNSSTTSSTSAMSSSPNSQTTSSVQYACIQLIRSLLREGYQLGQQSNCKPFLDKLNLVMRGTVFRNLELSKVETQDLQACLKQIIKSVKDKVSMNPSSTLEQSTTNKAPSVPFIKIERVDDEDDDWYGTSSPSPLPPSEIKNGISPNSTDCLEGPCWPPIRIKSQEEEKSGPSGPSTAFKTGIKKEMLEKPQSPTSEVCISSETICKVSPTQSVVDSSMHQSLKPKVELSGWQSKLSKVMEKSSNYLKSKKNCDAEDKVVGKESKLANLCPSKDGKRGNSVIENKMRGDCAEGICGNESKITPSPYNVQIKTEPCDLQFKSTSRANNSIDNDQASDGNDCIPPMVLKTTLKKKKKVFNSDNFPVNQQLKRLSLEHKVPEEKPGSLKREAHLDQKSNVLGKTPERKDMTQTSTPNLVEKRNDLKLGREADSDDDDDDLPLSLVRKRIMTKGANMLPITDSQVDRDLDHLSLAAHAKCISFPVDSSQDSMASQEPYQIERKVKGTVRSPLIDDSSSDTDVSNDQIITISDSSSEEETKPSITKSVKMEKHDFKINKGDWPSTSASDTSKAKSEVKIKSETCDECDSQFFEFETEEEVFSVWGDSQVDKEEPTHTLERKKPSNLLTTQDTDLNLIDIEDYNQWGYDTDFISDDVIQKAAEAAEEQLKVIKSVRIENLNTDTKKESSCSKTTNEVFLASGFYGKDVHASITAPKKTSPLSKLSRGKKTGTVLAQKIVTKSKANRTKSPLKAPRQNKRFLKPESPRKTSTYMTSPAVVPPKKDRKCPEPTNAVEKLGLKKAPRKAFDLSQRSLDSLAELRSHGKEAGFVDSKRQKTKLIPPQALLMKGNQKLLACQFYRQTRPKESEKGARAENPENGSGRVETAAKKTRPKTDRETSGTSKYKKKRTSTDLVPNTSREGKQKNTHVSLEAHNISTHIYTTTTASENTDSVTQHDTGPCAKIQEDEISGPFLGELMHLSRALHGANLPSVSTTVKVTESNGNEEDVEEDHLFLTQADPVDMEICSQEENEIGIGMLEGNGPSNTMVESSASLPKSAEQSQCKHRDCLETVKIAGENCPKHTIPEKADDHLFAKPGLPLSLQKPPKPSTAKVFSTGNTSRNANLTRDLENIVKLQGSSKPKPQPVKPPTPRLAVTPSIQNRSTMPQTVSGVLQPLINQTNIPLLPSFTAGSEAGIIRHPAAKPTPGPPRDQAVLMREILQWKYEMFDKLSKFGSPNDLCQLPPMKVPLKFSSYDEYFNVFFPLMLLNTFESLGQQWSEKQKAITSHVCKLQLQSFCTDSEMKRGDFQVWFRDADLNSQRHPKEDDLVFLLTPPLWNSFSGEEAEPQGPLIYHTGHVSRFTRSQRTQTLDKEQYTLCDLCIHTHGNLSRYRNHQVQCVVIGNLITTQRQFRALLQLQRSPLFRPIVHPYPADFFPRDMVGPENCSFLTLKEYNSDQKSAIEKAYAMVKQQPRQSRICLIHGPPGTGKSKTIVGLLYRMMMENINKVTDQNFNAKNKRNRVLVCAPSNAALDDLMKKIILEFKDKCHDKRNTLGNCGDINLVRLGSERTISNDVVKFSLDSQVNYRISRAHQDQNIHRQKEALDRQLDELSRERAMEKCNKNTCVQLEEKIARLSKERQLLANALKELRRRPQEVQRNIILESHVICCTLSTSGGFLLESAFRQLGQEPFSCVIVDEAGQACEVETLIPLVHRCSKLVLVGDPEQLPSTVISVKAEELGYGQSLMSRLCRHLESAGQRNGVMQLTVQYRMHPDICLFPSHYIYRRMLKTDRATEETRCSSEWPFQPYMLFDIADGFEKKERESFANPHEIKVVMALIKLIKSKMKEFTFRNIGVITPYRAQKMMIVDALRKEFGNDNRPAEVDTVDGFQGRQKDCIIVTCVRANPGHGCIGFLASRQRLNVTITRAKFSLFILGSLRTLMENKDWNELIQDAQRRGALVKTKEENYFKDVNKILKLKPIVQRAPSFSSSRPEEKSDDRHKTIFSHAHRPEAPRESYNPPRTALSAPPRAVVHPAVDCRRDAVKSSASSSVAVAIPAPPREKLQDPRLARRLETARDTNPAPAGSLHQSNSDLGRASTSHRQYSPLTAGAKRAHQPTLRDSRSLSEGNNGSRHRENNMPPEKGLDNKRRKVSH
ncbi:hypothetical protein FKM82_005519 [Ascaphus truei]